jgi:hypothetical protein
MREPKQLEELQSVAALQELRNFHQELVQTINFFRAPSFTTATRPTAAQAGAGAIIFVSDAAAGSNFQGSTGTAWVSLG